MKLQYVLLILLIISFGVLTPSLTSGHEVNLLPEVPQSVSFNTFAPVIVIASDVSGSVVRVNISIFGAIDRSTAPIISDLPIGEEIEVEIDRPGIYILDLVTDGSGSVRIDSKGLFIQNSITIGILSLLNIVYFVYRRYTYNPLG